MSKIYKLKDAESARPFPISPVKSIGEAGVDTLFDIEGKAYEKGFTTGEMRGMELGQERVKGLEEKLLFMLEGLLEFRERFYVEKDKELLELVMAVTRKVVHAELSVNRDVIINVLDAAIRAVTTSDDLAIRMNPDDLAYLKDNKPDMLKNLDGIKGFSVKGDPGVGKGGCVIQTNHGEIDARIEEGLRSIEFAMEETVRG